MATTNRSGPPSAANPMADATAPTAVREVMRKMADEVSVPLSQALGLVDLLMWIERARKLDANISFYRQHVPSLKETLEEHSITTLGWDESEEDALDSLHWSMRQQLEKVIGVVDSAHEEAKAAEGLQHG